MKKASSFIVLLLLGSLMADATAQVPGSSFPTYNQPGQGQGHQGQGQGQWGSQSQIISEVVQITLPSSGRVRVPDLLRVTQMEARDMELIALSINAQTIKGQASLDILEQDRAISAAQIVKKQLKEIRIPVPAGTNLSALEIAVSDEVIIQSITAEVRSIRQGGSIGGSHGGGQGGGQGGQWPQPDMQPMPGQLVKLQINRDIRISGELPLKQLAKQQLGLSLEGAQIERIAVEATVTRGYSASVQLEMNQRIVASKAISASQRATPLLMNSLEEVRGNLRLLVRGDVIIHAVSIRIGQVRPTQPQLPQSQRVQVSQEISSGRALELGRLLPYESRLITAISLEARTSRAQAEVALVALGQVVASAIVTQVPMRPVLQLFHPMSAQELRLQSLSPVMIDAIEVEFERRQIW